MQRVLLHACCAPCSSAIVEWLLAHEIKPVIFYYNPNIYPREEYEIRKAESKRHAESLGIQWIDADYSHDEWLQGICGLENEPERGKRCPECFRYSLTRTSERAAALGIDRFTTSLTVSPLKDSRTIFAVGSAFPGFEAIDFMKRDGYLRSGILAREYGLYRQKYCGCEFSYRPERIPAENGGEK